MAADIDIANLALGRIGVRSFISAFTDNSENAEVCNQFYPLIRDKVLSSFPWAFAQKRAPLALLTQPMWSVATTYALNQQVTYDATGKFVTSLVAGNVGHQPTGTADAFWSAANPQARPGYAFMYALPPDCMIARSLYTGTRTPIADQRAPFIVEVSDDLTTPVLLTDQASAELIYTAKITQPTSYPPAVVDAIAWALAIELATTLRVDVAFRERAEKNYQEAWTRAAAVDMNQGNELEPQSEIISSRGDSYPWPFQGRIPPWWGL